jgi:hypothetical protein
VFVLAPFPAYMVPTIPGPLSLNAEPVAAAAFPGSIAVALLSRQVWFGWPIVPGLPATLDAAGGDGEERDRGCDC